MQTYIWEYTEPVTDEYHDGGGLLITAPTLERAREMWEHYPKAPHKIHPGYAERDNRATGRDPDQTLAMGEGANEAILVFPDAGCC